MKKLKNTCLLLVITCALGSTNTMYGSQRFVNFARYAAAAATRCSQAFQTAKQSKPIKWIATNPSTTLYIGSAIATALAIANYKEQSGKEQQKELESLLESYGIKDIQVPTKLSPITEKIAFLKKLSANEAISGKDIYRIFLCVTNIREDSISIYMSDLDRETLFKDFQEPMMLLLQLLLDRQDVEGFLRLDLCCPQEWKKSLHVDKTVYKDLLAPFDFCRNNKTSAGRPLFSNAYFESTITYFLGWSFALNRMPTDKYILAILEKIRVFTAQEYAKERIVIFHGQHDQWEFFEKIFNALLKIKYGTTTPKDYVRLRFCEQPLLSDEEATEIRRDGITKITFKKYRPKVLFVNLHLIANREGSNSLSYILSNSDQTMLQNGFDFNQIKTCFANFEMSNELDSLQGNLQNQFYNFYHVFKEECDLGLEIECDLWLENLYDLYKKAITARNNAGRLVAISLPKEVARTLCYKTKSGAPLNPVLINGELTTDVVTIAENYGQVPFENEYVLILSDTITNPEKAAAAGIVMKTFTSEPTEESKKLEAEFEAEFTKVMDRIAEIYHARIAQEK